NGRRSRRRAALTWRGGPAVGAAAPGESLGPVGGLGRGVAAVAELPHHLPVRRVLDDLAAVAAAELDAGGGAGGAAEERERAAEAVEPLRYEVRVAAVVAAGARRQ